MGGWNHRRWKKSNDGWIEKKGGSRKRKKQAGGACFFQGGAIYGKADSRDSLRRQNGKKGQKRFRAGKGGSGRKRSQVLKNGRQSRFSSSQSRQAKRVRKFAIRQFPDEKASAIFAFFSQFFRFSSAFFALLKARFCSLALYFKGKALVPPRGSQVLCSWSLL